MLVGECVEMCGDVNMYVMKCVCSGCVVGDLCLRCVLLGVCAEVCVGRCECVRRCVCVCVCAGGCEVCAGRGDLSLVYRCH